MSTIGNVYVFKTSDPVFYKIGETYNDVEFRLRQMLTYCPLDIELLVWARVSNGYAVEKKIHKLYRKQRRMGEWFELSPQQEKELIELIEDIDEPALHSSPAPEEPEATPLRSEDELLGGSK